MKVQKESREKKHPLGQSLLAKSEGITRAEQALLILTLLLVLPLSAFGAEESTGSELAAPEAVSASAWHRWYQAAGIGGHARFDYYSASKKLDNSHSLPGLTFQPKALPKFGSWGDGKIEARITDQDLRREGGVEGRLLEGYTNFYGRTVDVRLGKQIITWGRADALNPTDNLTPKDFTLLSAKDEDERRTGSWATKANYYLGAYTLSATWIPIFNPNRIPLTAPPGITITEEKRDTGDWTDQGFAIKLDHTGGDLDWSVSYYYGRDLNPVGIPTSPTSAVLIHTRTNVFGFDLARSVGRYGVRAEAAYTQTQNPDGTNPFIKKPNFYAVEGVDRDLTEDLNVNLQVYQRIIVNYRDPFAIQDPIIQNAAVLDATFNNQLNRYQWGLAGRVKATALNKTLEAQLLGQWNQPRSDFFIRPSLAYAFTDVWKGYIGWDVFNGQQHSFFGRLQPATSFFGEVRATF
ncbi:hypothetical protein [Petrachloros mirabilis]